MANKAKPAPNAPRIMQISVDIIEAPALPARFETIETGLDELAKSIRTVGVIEPIIVKAVGKKYEVIAGDRRLRAARLAGIPKIPAIVQSVTAKRAEQLKAHENLFRQDLNPAEEAIYMQRLIKEMKVKQTDLAKLMGKSEGYISQRLAMLSWPEALLRAVNDGEVLFTVARELMSIKSEGDRTYYIDTVLRAGANLAQVKNWVAIANAPKPGEGEAPAGSGAGDDTVTPPPFKPTCFVCEEQHEFKDVITAQICRPCAKVIRETVGEGK